MTDTKCQPGRAEPYQHVCPEADCIYYGQPTNGGMCGCHRTREQVMAARIEELTKALMAARLFIDDEFGECLTLPRKSELPRKSRILALYDQFDRASTISLEGRGGAT